ncbi:VWA domain-containing protein [Nitratireductor aquimarinus]|uniref:DUF5801 repeats-in-toxin domain-containing protein n=1 Tax=Alphaproteobacteria TaxID=28211 RepID=UPI0019D34D33|nr:DUF5801 repeats-in-toxin domain-containing protein [Tritonibacter mobilis]MBN7756657.1 VWA domain-containing protein [Nitratireductor aquimarinus]MBY5999726.1 VWA domain-containing protein [Tritonibacter mobilis]MBY6021752.1 VWA domain-containing protein [Nitratireductor sp. DP7N14-4]
MPAASLPAELAADADNVVRLPQGVSIDEIRLDGNNLVLVQPDGSTVTILNAALKVPTFLIGDVEIPELALAAALQANGIDVAAGPDGALTVVSAASQSGGGGFNTPNGDIGDAGPVIDLLPPTALQFGTLERRELFPSNRENDFPELSIVSLGTPPGQVNESALASGSGGGTTSTLGNVLVDPGDDGLGSLVVTNASGVSVDVTNGGSIQGVYGELIVTPNGDGTYSFEYVLTTNTIDHANAGQTGADDVVTDTFDFVVTDGNGDTASDELTITITDDGPAIDLAPAAESEIVLDETDNDADDGDVGGLLADLTVPGSALFTETATPGADGAQSKVYSLILNAGATGLTDTLSGEPVVLSEEGGAIVGRTQTGGDEVFRISVDANTGDITVSQSRALFHDQNPGSDAEAHDESLTPEVMNSGLVSLNVVLTDGDGDTASDTAELGALIKFQDDGPVLGEVTAVAAGALTLDESLASDGGLASDTLALAGHFAAVNYGTDGAGTTTYGFALSGSGDPVASGLYALNSVDGTFTQGTEITLSLSADGQTITGSADSEDYFTITVDDTGTVTFTQLNNIWHSDVEDADDAEVLSLAADTLVLQQTVTDQDGDSVTADLDLSGGVFEIEDDGPVLGEVTAVAAGALTLDESLASDGGLASDTLALAGHFAAVNYGTDGAGTTTYGFALSGSGDPVASGLYALNSVDGTFTQGTEITLSLSADGQTITGSADSEDYFTITVDDTGTVTFTQLNNIWHSDVEDADDAEVLSLAADTLVLQQTVTDQDGDSVTADLDLSGGVFEIEDDGPTIIVPKDAVLSNSAGTPREFDLDLDGMVTDNYGTDGAGTVRFTVTDGQDSGLTSGGQPITYHLSAGGTALTAKVGGAEGTTVFTVTLDPADGTYTVDMDRPVDAFTQVDFDPGIYDFVGGNDPWAGFVPNGQDGSVQSGSPVDDNSRDLLLTPIGASGSSINGNANSAGVGGSGSSGQNIGTGEGIRLDFVHDLTGDPAGAPADYQGNVGQQDHLFDGHYTVNGAAVTFGDGSSDTTIQLSAFDDPDGNTTVGDGTGDDITSIVIAYDGENQVITYDQQDTYPTTVTVGSSGGLADRSYTVDFVMVGGARVAEVTGVLDTRVTITSFTADGYNSLEVLYISGDDFAMTGFGTSVVSTDPVDFTLPIEIVDGDGDTAPAEIDITLQPDAAPTISAFTTEVNEAGLAGGSEEGAASTMDTGALSIALASGDTLDTLEVSDVNGNWVDVTGGGTVQGKFGLLTVTANGSGGYSSSYQLNQNSLDHNVRPGKGTPEGVAERFNVRAKDNDGDYSAVDTLKVNVLDDAPEAVADNASLTLGTENFNIAFVLDFSGSVSKNELDAMLDAVKAAGQAFFDGTSGNVQIELVAFSSSARAAGPFTDYVSFAAQINAWNPDEGGSRPYNGGTNFTAAIQKTMAVYTPLSDHNNQVFFLSDGNPNDQTGTDGHSLNGSTQTDWNNFVQDNDVTVQTVGIGNNIDNEQLQDLDEADGSDVVVSVSNFDDLVTALLDLTNQVDVSGNVLLGNDNAVGGGDDDILGADGGRILSITVDGVTYTYQVGPDKIFNDGGQPAISGSSLVVDGALGGELSFNFETGAWSYQADGGTTPGTESFDYVLVDNDGDTSGASLTIDILPPPGATDDVVLTNITDYSAIDIPTAALLHNDPAPASPLSVDGASNPQNGGVSLAGDVTFTPSSTPVEFVDEDFSSGEGSFIYRDAYYPGTGSQADGFRSTSGPASGGAMKIELGDGGGSDRYNVNGAFTRAFNLASAATVTITFDYYAMLTAETDVGEDVRVLAGVDGEAFGSGGVVDELLGASGSSGGDAVTGWKTFTTTIDLSAGDHTLALGGLLTQKTKSGEFAEVYFDNVNVEYTPTPSFTSGGFDYSVSDGSGFTDDAHVSVTGVSGSTITGTDADEVLVGGDAADLLDGGEGDDFLIGGDGADVLIGGEGQNTYDLTDTDGAIDTVVLDPSALTGMNPDEIIGFSSEDVVDISELVSLSTTPDDSIGDFVRLNPGDGKELQVDADGTAGGDDWVTVATFDVQPPASITILYKDDNGSDTSGTF